MVIARDLIIAALSIVLGQNQERAQLGILLNLVEVLKVSNQITPPT